jgi:hypothetical protein
MNSALLFIERCTAVALILFSGWSCTEDNFFSDAEKSANNDVNEVVSVYNLTEDIEVVNEIITLLPFGSNYLKNAGILWEHDLVLILVANIPVPDSGEEEVLSASSLFVDRDYGGDGVKAFIGYSTRGDSTRGGLKILTYVDEFNKTDNTVLFDADVNDIYVEGNVAYLACSDYNLGAVVYSVNTGTLDVDTVFVLSEFFGGDVPATANGIAPLSSKLVISAGRTHGGAFIIEESGGEFEKDTARIDSTAKSIDTNFDQDEIALLLGGGASDNAELFLLNPTVDLIKSIDLGSPIEFQNVEESAKYSGRAQVRYINDTLVIATLGKHGAALINTDTEDILFTPNDMLIDGNTNSVSYDTMFVYYANGADGLFLADFDTDSIEEMVEPEWVWNTYCGMPPGSVNSVESDGEEWVVVAKGLDGVHLLKFESDSCGCCGEKPEIDCDTIDDLFLSYLTENVFFRTPAHEEEAESPWVNRTFNADNTITVENFVGKSDEEEWLEKFFNNDGTLINDTTSVTWELIKEEECDLVIMERWISKLEEIDTTRELHLLEWEPYFFSVKMFTYETGGTPVGADSANFVYINKTYFQNTELPFLND